MQSGNVVLQRRPATPRSWIGRQRAMVGGSVSCGNVPLCSLGITSEENDVLIIVARYSDKARFYLPVSCFLVFFYFWCLVHLIKESAL